MSSEVLVGVVTINNSKKYRTHQIITLLLKQIGPTLVESSSKVSDLSLIRNPNRLN